MGTYAPKSPDLSSFYSSGPTSEGPASAPPDATATGAQPRELPSQQSPSQFSPHQQRVHLQPLSSTYFADAPAVTQQHTHSQHSSPSSYRPPSFSSPAGQTVPQAGSGYTVPQPSQKGPFYPRYDTPYKSQFPLPAAQFYGHEASVLASTPAIATTVASGEPLSAVSATSDLASSTMPPKRGGSAAGSSTAGIVEPSPVRTKFPTARIKRIMQADEEVGKVAQQTPIAVGKALEMFMIELVTRSADVAREKSSKRVSAQMLKQVIESDEQWDFLREIVGRVENDEKAGSKAKAAKTESESEDEPAEKKKRVGRKRKAA